VNGTIYVTNRNLEIYHPSFAVDVLMTWRSKRGTCWCNMLRIISWFQQTQLAEGDVLVYVRKSENYFQQNSVGSVT